MNPVQISGGREAAYLALSACEKQGAWSDQAIKNASKKLNLNSRDAALASHICYGIMQNKLQINAWINHFSNTPVEKLDLSLLVCIQIGMYQIHFLDRVPSRAAVNESVNLAHKYCKNRAGGNLVNAVLRSFVRAGQDLPQTKSKNPLELLSIQYSHPIELVELFASELEGDSLAQFLTANNHGSDTVIQVNTLKTKSDLVRKELEDAGVSVEKHPWMPDCFTIKNSGNIENLAAFKNGDFYVQDCAAKLCSVLSGIRENMIVLDTCAAPGGKSFASAIAMNNTGSIVSCDLHEKKLTRIQSGAKRLGITTIATQVADGRIEKPEWVRHFDAVITDVPCSGLGIIRKKPDIRYKDLKETENLPVIQADILENASKYVKEGGVLMYSTCTVLKRENQDVVNSFLEKHAEFSLESFNIFGCWDVPEGMITLWPHIHGTDGFFIAKLRRNK